MASIPSLYRDVVDLEGQVRRATGLGICRNLPVDAAQPEEHEQSRRRSQARSAGAGQRLQRRVASSSARASSGARSTTTPWRTISSPRRTSPPATTSTRASKASVCWRRSHRRSIPIRSPGDEHAYTPERDRRRRRRPTSTGVPEPTRAALAELCRIIASSDPRVRAEIKWNAPSFAIDDHFATTGMLKAGGVRLVLHTGRRRTAGSPSRDRRPRRSCWTGRTPTVRSRSSPTKAMSVAMSRR